MSEKKFENATKTQDCGKLSFVQGLLERAIPFVEEWVAECKHQYEWWKGRESAGKACSLKADIDEGEAILAAAEKGGVGVREEPKLTGDAALMRAILEALVTYWDWNGYDAGREIGLKQLARNAVAAPARNCDVGTVQEQCLRFRKHCTSRDCENCELKDSEWGCEFAWGQLPYERTETGHTEPTGPTGSAGLTGREQKNGTEVTNGTEEGDRANEPIRRRNCINWSGDHCARTKGIFCREKCPEYRNY